jgi:hypothetical protein
VKRGWERDDWNRELKVLKEKLPEPLRKSSYILFREVLGNVVGKFKNLKIKSLRNSTMKKSSQRLNQTPKTFIIENSSKPPTCHQPNQQKLPSSFLVVFNVDFSVSSRSPIHHVSSPRTHTLAVLNLIFKHNHRMKYVMKSGKMTET